MSVLKRSHPRPQAGVKAVSPPLPPSKRLKTTKSSHVPTHTDLGFLVDEDARHGKILQAKLTNGVPNSRATKVDESHAVLASDTNDVDPGADVGDSPDHAIGISSGDESSDSEADDEDFLSDARKGTNDMKLVRENGHESSNGHGDVESQAEDAALGARIDTDMAQMDEQAEAEEMGELSFGEMLQARHPDPIDVEASFLNPMADRQALMPVSGDRTLTAPSGTSLTTVLTQALKTNDKDLLESCFHTTDLPSIRATIQRLQSSHAVTLISRLAERIHKRPGRTGSLLVWVQWSLIAHGGYLASQPGVMAKLKSLAQVIQQRASGLQSLLRLKGKLDMLSAQIDLRRSMQAASRAANMVDDQDDEEGVVYVENQGMDWSDSDDEVDETMEDLRTGQPFSKSKRQTATPRSNSSDESNDDDDDDMPNGVMQEVDEGSSDEEEEDEGLFDVEADETSDDEGEDEEDDEDSEDEIDSDAESGIEEDSGDESDASAVKRPLPKTLNRKR